MNRTFPFLAAAVAALAAFGRGEPWLPPPSAPPSTETLTNVARYLEWKWRTDVSDPKTGLDAAALSNRVWDICRAYEDKEPWCLVKARMYAALCDEMAIDVSPLDWFPAMSVWNRYRRPLTAVVNARDKKVEATFNPGLSTVIADGNRSGKWRIWKDFDHSIPEWEKILALGFAGMRERLLANWKEDDVHRAWLMSADASLRLVGRLARQARVRNLPRQAETFERLQVGAPRTAYEALQFIFLYFFMSEHLDVMQCRSLSILDQTLWPYYRADVEAGRTSEKEFREQLHCFFWQWGSIDNYWGHPVTLGGTNADGSSACNPLTLIILDVADRYAQPSPKFHLKVEDNTPQAVLDKALDMARRHRPLSFCGEKPIRRILGHYGYTPDETLRFYTKGCYEFCIPEAGNGTVIGYVNLVKPIERMLQDAKDGRFDAADYPEFESAYFRRIGATMDEALGIIGRLESHLDDVNPANVASLAVENSVKTGRDAFADGSRRGNNTTVLVTGFGTTVDALVAVRTLVYERREVTLARLGGMMADDWRDCETVRCRMLRAKEKWGNNDPTANATGRRLSETLAKRVNGKRNSRGGIYGLSGHCARQFLVAGELTGATPDGRRARQELSKNLSPTPGADTEGATALVQTLGTLDAREFPGDFPLDVMLHSSSVQGEEGLSAMRALLKVYFDNGGAMVQFNVFSLDELRDARRHPEKYENLQVRVCGWNVRWNDLSPQEQDGYLRRLESIPD